MEIMNFRFNTTSFVLLFINIILIPVSISKLHTSYINMRYYQRFTEGMNQYNSGNLDQSRYLLEEALEIKNGEPGATILLGTIELLQQKHEVAKKHFTYIKEISFGDEGMSATLGEIVSEMFILSENTKKINNPIVYRNLESKIKILTQQNPEFTDAYIAWGHIFLLQARFYRDNNNVEKEKEFFEEAKSRFQIATKKIATRTPSKLSCYSLYLGLGEISYWESQQILKEILEPEPESSEALEVFNKTKDAVDYYKRAFLYNIKENPEILNNIDYCYGRLLSYPWLTVKEREKVTKEAEFYLKHLQNFYNYANEAFGGRQRVNEIWKISPTGYIENGLGIAYFHNKNFKSSLQYFQNANKKKIPFAGSNYHFAILASINSGYQKNGAIIGEYSRNIGNSYIRNIVKNIYPQFKKNKTISKADFVILNNYLLTIYRTKGIGDDVEKIIEMSAYLKGMKFETQKGEMQALKIFGHNLYLVYKNAKKPEAEKWKKYLLAE